MELFGIYHCDYVVILLLLSLPASFSTYPDPAYSYSDYRPQYSPASYGYNQPPAYDYNQPQWDYRSLPDPGYGYNSPSLTLYTATSAAYPPSNPSLTLYTGSNAIYPSSTALGAQPPGYTVPTSTVVLPPPAGPYFPLSSAAASRYLLPGLPLPNPPQYPAAPYEAGSYGTDYVYPRSADPSTGSASADDMMGSASGTSGSSDSDGSSGVLFGTMAAEPNPEQQSMGELFSRLHWKAPKRRPVASWPSTASDIMSALQATTTEDTVVTESPTTTTTETPVTDEVTVESSASPANGSTTGIPIIELPMLATQLTKYEQSLKSASGVSKSIKTRLHTFILTFANRPEISPATVKTLSGILDAVLLTSGLSPSLQQATNNLKSGLDAYLTFAKTADTDALWQSLLRSALTTNLGEMPPASMSFAMGLVQSILARIIDCRTNPDQCEFVNRVTVTTPAPRGKFKVWGLRKSAEVLEKGNARPAGESGVEQPVVMRGGSQGAGGQSTGGTQTQSGRNVVIVM